MDASLLNVAVWIHSHSHVLVHEYFTKPVCVNMNTLVSSYEQGHTLTHKHIGMSELLRSPDETAAKSKESPCFPRSANTVCGPQGHCSH